VGEGNEQKAELGIKAKNVVAKIQLQTRVDTSVRKGVVSRTT